MAFNDDLESLYERIGILEADLKSAKAVRDAALIQLGTIFVGLETFYQKSDADLRSEVELQRWAEDTADLVERGLLPEGARVLAGRVEEALTRVVAERGIKNIPCRDAAHHLMDVNDEVDVVDGKDVAHG